MTPEELRAIRERCEAATPVPWSVDEKPMPWGYWTVRGPENEEVFDDGSAAAEYGQCCRIEDRDFLVAARTDIPALLDEVERLRAEHEQMFQECKRMSQARHDEAEADAAVIRERDEARAEVERLQDENESLKMRLDIIEAELKKPEDERLREVLEAMQGISEPFGSIGMRVRMLVANSSEWLKRCGEAERERDAAKEETTLEKVCALEDRRHYGRMVQRLIRGELTVEQLRADHERDVQRILEQNGMAPKG